LLARRYLGKGQKIGGEAGAADIPALDLQPRHYVFLFVQNHGVEAVTDGEALEGTPSEARPQWFGQFAEKGGFSLPCVFVFV
jgi:hypothetical protein